MFILKKKIMITRGFELGLPVVQADIVTLILSPILQTLSYSSLCFCHLPFSLSSLLSYSLSLTLSLPLPPSFSLSLSPLNKCHVLCALSYGATFIRFFCMPNKSGAMVLSEYVTTVVINFSSKGRRTVTDCSTAFAS